MGFSFRSPPTTTFVARLGFTRHSLERQLLGMQSCHSRDLGDDDGRIEPWRPGLHMYRTIGCSIANYCNVLQYSIQINSDVFSGMQVLLMIHH